MHSHVQLGSFLNRQKIDTWSARLWYVDYMSRGGQEKLESSNSSAHMTPRFTITGVVNFSSSFLPRTCEL